MTAEWMVRLMALGQQGSKLFPDRLDEVRLECRQEIYAPSSWGASDNPQMIEHLVPVYVLTHFLLAEALNSGGVLRIGNATEFPCVLSPCLLKLLFEERHGRFAGKRPREVMSLGHLAPHLSQPFELPGGLDALGYHLKI